MSRGLRAIFMILFPFFYISENHSYDTRSAQSNDFTHKVPDSELK